MIDEEMAEEWVKENMDCVKTVSYLNHDCNYFSDEERSIAKSAFKDGYNKANEWYYVKDGDLPEHEVNVLVLFNEQCIDIAHYNWDYKEWHFTDSIVRDVIAWKEIVLPKEK